MDRTSPAGSSRGAAAIALWTILALAPSAGVRAESAVPNPELDDDESGWALPVGVLGEWSGEDLDGCEVDGAPTSGSYRSVSAFIAMLQFSLSGAGSSGCMPVEPGATVFFEISYRSTLAAVTAAPFVYETVDCSGEGASVTTGSPSPPSDSWALARHSLVIPVGAQSIRAEWLAMSTGPTTHVVHWDRAFMGGVERVFADDFEARSTCRWQTADLPLQDSSR